MKWLRRAVVSLALFLTACSLLLLALPKLMIAPMKTARAEVILHSAIAARSKADDYVMNLYRQGTVGKIVCLSSQVSWEIYPADYAREHLIALGAPAEDVMSLRLPITPCGALKLPVIADFVKSQGWKSVLWITNPEESRYLARRAAPLFEREGIALVVSYAPEDKEELTRGWLRTHWKAQRFAGDALNIALDFFYAECR
jgi:hypothetical protein